MKNADKWIRKYFVDTLNNMVVNGKTITIHDMRIPDNKDAYILMTTQQKSEGDPTKCNTPWDCYITLDVVTIYNNIAGSRLLADDIMEEVMKRTQNVLVNGFTVKKQSLDFPPDISTITSTQAIFRKLVTFNLIISENG
ncbi:hypothetical protein HZP84_16300 [Elizabethkingia anophelis]|nr:hypothetical protein [Elizabethkingia anophelis]MCT3824624.1 hypothetical protein [Elizabethkingia anophelis]MCT3931917.1 hypothetical protein [Elizabethkingia anophelis]MCT4078024.1 hypothetical protein [Elizabethkingia anophelis]MCT4081689.1 hypothetical protein [Elizabethkingia anophelis]